MPVNLIELNRVEDKKKGGVRTWSLWFTSVYLKLDIRRIENRLELATSIMTLVDRMS